MCLFRCSDLTVKFKGRIRSPREKCFTIVPLKLSHSAICDMTSRFLINVKARLRKTQNSRSVFFLLDFLSFGFYSSAKYNEIKIDYDSCETLAK